MSTPTPSISAHCPWVYRSEPHSISATRCHKCHYVTYLTHPWGRDFICGNPNCGHKVYSCSIFDEECEVNYYVVWKKCWACGTELPLNVMSCFDCRMVYDGSELYVWKNEKDNVWERKDEKKIGNVDIDELKKMWRRENNKIVKPVRVCEGCGKKCKGPAGLKTHLRACKVGEVEGSVA